jgi:cytolysin (calcineurin-like family phosphatase)
MIHGRCSCSGSAAVPRRAVITGFLAALAVAPATRVSVAADGRFDVTFLFTADIHACRMPHGLSPHCKEEGKTEHALRRHVAGINRVHHYRWPHAINGSPTGLHGTGEPIALPLGLVIGGDMTDDGGGQVEHPGRPLRLPGQTNLLPGEGRQLAEFSELYRRTASGDGVRFPVYLGLGNHDLDQDGPPEAFDWYRDELRDYVKLNHMRSRGDLPRVPVTSYDDKSDCYSWDWGELHLVQAHRYPGDTTKGAVDSLPWIEHDLASRASDGRPVIIFQHYGWDRFSAERWDPATKTFTATGSGAPHWWGESEWQALRKVLGPYNVIAVLHGHEHENTLHYRWNGLDVIKPRAGFLGGFAILRVTERFMDVAFAEVTDDLGNLRFTGAFAKMLSPSRPGRG